jgi:hypothetical protein
MTDTRRQFQTAVHRRGGRLIKFDVQTYLYDEENEDAEPVEVNETLTVDPKLDILAVAGAASSFAEALSAFGKTRDVEAGKATPEELAAAAGKLKTLMGPLRQSLRECLTPPARIKWDRIVDTLDLATLGGIVRLISNELSGLDPTPPASSSAGSSTDGNSSTAGAPAAESTPDS